MRKILLLALLALLLPGCASPPKLYKVESVYVCAAEECGQAAQNYSTEQMLTGLTRLLEANDGQELKVCESSPKSRDCKSHSACHFVQGGPFPGLGCISTFTLTAPKFDDTDKRIHFKNKPGMTFLGIGLICEDHEGSLAVRSPDEIAWEDHSYYCNWMGAGNMVNTFSIAVEFVDFDRGVLGGYWTHTNTGTGNGSGSGYAIMQLPKAMPRGEDWLTPN